jgi:hypothetical protein
MKLVKLYHSGIVPANCAPCNQYKQVHGQGLLIKLDSGNNCVGLGEDVVIVSNILSVVDDVLLVCKKLRHIENFFDYPLESKLLGVLLVHELREEDCLLSVKLFKCKYLKVANMLPFPWLITKISYNDSCIILPPYVSLCPSLLQ